MDQPFDFTNFCGPPSQFSQNLLTVTQANESTNLNVQSNIQSNLMSQKQVIHTLQQICSALDQELTLQLRKNQLLLVSMYNYNFLQSLSSIPVKEEQVCQQILKLEEDEKVHNKRTVKEKKLTINDTKNISKNFGKAVITFIQKNPQKVRRILQVHNIDLTLFCNELKQRKKNLISIKELRSLWLQSEFEYAKPFREISYLFLRKASFKYIFGSRIADYAGHLKYRTRMLEALHSPKQFTSIKQ